jgi:hypothetical protein
MRRSSLTVAAACVVVGLAAPSHAGQVRLEIRGGLVTLEAKDATIREIFAEWARVGKTVVVNAESLPPGPLTLQLAGVPERQALETLLRPMAGFLAVARTVTQDFTSIYDRIVVMPVARPTVVATSASGRPVSQPPQLPSRDRIIVPPPTAADDDDEAYGALMPGQGAYGGALQPGMPTAPAPIGGVGMANSNFPQASQTPQPPPYAQPSPRPGMVTAPVKPPAQTGPIK